MQRKYLMASHGHLASGMQSSINILAGKGEEDYQKVQGRYDFYESDLAIARRCLGL